MAGPAPRSLDGVSIMPAELPMLAAIAPAPPPTRDERWMRAARMARLLSWVSLAWMTVEGAVGIYADIAASSIALVGWGLSSGVEGLASVIVIWRLTGERTLSDTSERRAQRAVAVSFFLLAPYVLVESVRTLIEGGHSDITSLGIALTASSVVLMPLLGRAKQRLGARLGSGATAGEGTPEPPLRAASPGRPRRPGRQRRVRRVVA